MWKRIKEMGVKLEEIKQRWNDDVFQYHIKRLNLNPSFEENEVRSLLLLGIDETPNFTQPELNMKIKDLLSSKKHLKMEFDR